MGHPVFLLTIQKNQTEYFTLLYFTIECNVNVRYWKIQVQASDIEDSNAPLNSSLDRNATAKIRLSEEYGSGIMFMAENFGVLLEFLATKYQTFKKFKEVKTANHIALVTGACDESKLIAAERFLYDSWHIHKISHTIVLLNDCMVSQGFLFESFYSLIFIFFQTLIETSIL